MASPPTFPEYPNCDQCALCASSTHHGLSTRQANGFEGGHATALLVVGEAPGYQEDAACRSWVGRSGGLLHRTLSLARLYSVADVYLSNACRCRPPQNHTPTEGNIKLCWPKLHRDLLSLAEAYDGRLVLLAAGASASFSLLRLNSTQAFECQGQSIPIARREDLCPECDGGLRRGAWGASPKGIEKKCPACKGTGLVGELLRHPPWTVPVFSTFHPAKLLREPSLIMSARDHYTLLHRHLSGESSPVLSVSNPVEVGEYALNPESPPDPRTVQDGLVSLDIETYGALVGQEQTVFHPRASEVVDLRPPSQLIATVALSWNGTDGQEHSAAFVWGEHYYHLVRWLTWMRHNGLAIIGQNVQFDISYLRYAAPVLKQYALEWGAVRLEDLILWNFLHSELRPERALKAVSTLFGLSNYKKFHLNAKTASDPELLSYNVLDTRVTLRARRLFLDAIARDYGPKSPKLSEWTRTFIHQLLWQIIHLSESGLPYDIPRVQAVQARHQQLSLGLGKDAEKKFGLIVSGKGSQGSIQKLVDDMVGRLDLGGDPRLILTDKTRKISTTEENLILIRSAVPAGHPIPEVRAGRRAINYLMHHRSHAHMVSNFTQPLLSDPHKGIAERRGPIGLAYPSWYPCPSKFDEDPGKPGGQVQGRMSCRRPGAQTSPAEIKATYTSRVPGWSILWADLSQIELRVPALMSGDPVMLEEYARGVDRHWQQGLILWQIIAGRDPAELAALLTTHGRKHPLVNYWRQGGKHTNFLIIYEGQAVKLTQLLRDKLGLVAGLDKTQLVIDLYNARYGVLRAWQRGLVELAVRQGYIELPTGWSRTYLGGRAAVEREQSTILNQSVQTIAAQLMESASYQILQDMHRANLRARMDLNVYDAVRINCPPEEAIQVRGFLRKWLPHPPLLAMLEQVYVRTVPLEFDLREIHASPEAARRAGG